MARKEAEEQSDAREVADDNHAELRVYELGFHIDPELPQEEVKKTYAHLHDLIVSKGSIVAEGAPEKIQLAYTVTRSETGGRRDFANAYFAWIVYETNGEGHGAITDAVRSEPRVIRFLDIRTTKEAAKHAADMREFSLKAPEKSDDADGVSDAELSAALEEVVA